MEWSLDPVNTADKSSQSYRVHFQTYSVIACLGLISGCVAGDMRANEATVARIDNMAIVPIEAPPLIAPKKILFAGLEQMAYGSAGGAVLYGILFAMDAPEATARSGRQSASIEQLLSKTDPWLPTMILAQAAQKSLSDHGYDAVTVDVVVREIPGVADRSYTFYMENWLGPIRSWYASEPSEVDYAGVADDASNVLEIGILNYEVTGSQLLLQVMMKLVDPRTRTVVARSREWKSFEIGDPDVAFANEGRTFKEKFAYWGEQLVGQALVTMNLIDE